MSELIQLFEQLKLPDDIANGDVAFSAVRIPMAGDRHVAKDRQGCPVVLFGTLPHAQRLLLNYALENLRIEHDLQCRIVDPSSRETLGRFTIFRCLSSDRGVQDYFLRIMQILLETVPAEASSEDLSQAIERLIALFRAIRLPSTKSVQGLWAELFLAVHARDPNTMLRAWHSDAAETSDFSSGAERLEVKSSGDRTRRHYFALEQLHAPSGTVQVVASLFVEPAAGGATVAELWNRARAAAHGEPDLLLKIEQTCLSALGDAWQDAQFRAYDSQRAAESLAFFDAKDIPKVSAELPRGVTDVRFRSDLSLARPIDTTAYRGAALLFDACFH